MTQKGRVLAGKRIVVTRSGRRTGFLKSMLAAEGAEPLEFPVIDIVPAAELPVHDPSVTFDWIIFTSGNAVHFFVNLLQRSRWSMSQFSGAKVGVIGPATADVAGEAGFEIDLIPTQFTAGNFAEAFRAYELAPRGKRVLLPRGNLATEELPSRLREMGCVVTEWIVYQTVAPHIAPDAVEALVKARPDAVILTSASTAANFCNSLPAAQLSRLKELAAFVSIGPITTHAAKAAGLEISAEAEQHDLAGVIQALKNFFDPGAGRVRTQ